jgi:hypothetical protein
MILGGTTVELLFSFVVMRGTVIGRKLAARAEITPANLINQTVFDARYRRPLIFKGKGLSQCT